MPELIPLTPCAGLALPVTAGAALEEWRPGPVTSVAPFAGAGAQVARALRPLGLDWPDANRMIVKGEARIAFAGRGTAFLIGVAAPEGLSAHAALTDQSDGWAALRLSGPDAVAVLARLVPLDLRERAFSPGSAVRSQLNHMPLLLMRAEAGFEILTFRSMARSAVREIGEAMRHTAARAALPG